MSENNSRIDRDTIQRIYDAVDIVDVVSDFVSLKRRGANYIGLCPFHNERTPSFSVSKARGICKCFSCGKGGSAVNFLMELENMSYGEAMRWLAKKYNIEIKERELSSEEKQREAERESMFAINDFAMKYYAMTLADTDEGRDIALAYFRERGINEQSIATFHLGYSPERGNAIIEAAKSAGYNPDILDNVGICAASDRGSYDRFHGRVIYPVLSLSGRVVAFGGRTLRSDKKISKYVNSPESIIYSKSRELYGLYQARRAIAKNDHCILVEGYMDVISMYQNGVENVVASSGTSLTEQQIQLIRRLTNNVTVIYDSDAAGIKASLRGIDMFLSQGMNVKVLLLPEGDDPDSFSQTHSAEETHKYITDNQTDFIHFKIKTLLQDAGDDPLKRAKAISSILFSVAAIPDDIQRQVYIDECARLLKMDNKVISLQVGKYVAQRAEENYSKRRIEQARKDAEAIVDTAKIDPHETAHNENIRKKISKTNVVQLAERELLRYVVRYGMLPLCESYDEENANAVIMNVYEYVCAELNRENIGFSSQAHAKLWERIKILYTDVWPEEYNATLQAIAEQMADERKTGIEKIRLEANNISELNEREKLLEEKIAALQIAEIDNFAMSFLPKYLGWDDDDDVRTLSADMSIDKFVLSKVHTKFTHVETEQERLAELVPRAVFELQDAILSTRIDDAQKRIAALSENAMDNREAIAKEMAALQQLIAIRTQFARFLGERIIVPRRR